MYRPGLASHPCIILANKADCDGAGERLRELRGHVARMRASGELEGLVIGSGEESGDGEGVASAVTAVSALHGRNLPLVVRRMRHGLTVASSILVERVEEERREMAAVKAREGRKRRAGEIGPEGKAVRDAAAARRAASAGDWFVSGETPVSARRKKAQELERRRAEEEKWAEHFNSRSRAPW